MTDRQVSAPGRIKLTKASQFCLRIAPELVHTSLEAVALALSNRTIF
jgi:hypothetical protein